MNISTLSDRIHSTRFDLIIDTCSTMHEGFERFILKNKEWLQNHDVKILVSKDVVKELIQNLEKENTEAEANKAIALIRENEEIFDVQVEKVSDEDISKAFADPEILNRINSGRIHKIQVLITNDKALNSDVQKLNDLQSCRGKEVFVVFLDNKGNMKTDKSLRNVFSMPENEPEKTAEILIQQNSVDETDISCGKKEEEKKAGKTLFWTNFGIGILAFVAGFATDKYGSEMVDIAERTAGHIFEGSWR